ncbi:MAG: (2Fe-2S)-binding protein [Synergistaceae bacterium]|jgi:NADH dehydrogenase/NADH:ubiquinone oxidoreductase subunit G|nr:(2Fe-2S)-binding protein [Synergistaceae bacterium]
MSMVTAVINGKACSARQGEFLLDVADRNDIAIPRLCHHESLRGLASCRLCLAEVSEGGRKRIVTSCVFPITRDIEVETNTEDIKNMRKMIIGFMLAQTPDNEKILQFAREYGSAETARFSEEKGNNCVVCGLCVNACEELGCGCLFTVNRGTTKKVAAPYEEPPEDCVGCGACAHVCPTGCIEIEETEFTRTIWGKAFEMINCSSCGKPFMPKAQYEYLAQKTDMPASPLCADCAQTALAKKYLLKPKYSLPAESGR